MLKNLLLALFDRTLQNDD